MGLATACAVKSPVLPEVDAGAPVPANATRIYFVDAGHASQVRIVGPEGSHREFRVMLDDDCCSYTELFEFVTQSLVDLRDLYPPGAELPVVVFSDGDAPASKNLGWHSHHDRETAWADLPARVYIGLGDIHAPRMIEAPYRVRERPLEVRTTFSLLIRPYVPDERFSVCIPPISGRGDPMGLCAPLCATEATPTTARDALDDPQLVRQLCDALDEPFDLLWSGGSLQEFVEVLVDDPRPPRCRGGTWMGIPNVAVVDPLRPRDVRAWWQYYQD